MGIATTCEPSTRFITRAVIKQAVESGKLTKGVMYECVKAGVPFVLAR